MKEHEKQTRKSYSKDGRSQKMMSFRLDNDVAELLAAVKNKGRLINDLIRKALEPQPAQDDPDADPGENDLEEYMT